MRRSIVASPAAWLVWGTVTIFFIGLAGVIGSVVVNSFGLRWFDSWLPEAYTTQWYGQAWDEFTLLPVLTVTLSLAALHAAGLALTPITIVTLPLVLGIGVDSCAYLAERYRGGAALDVAASGGGRAVVMSSITTMIGFGFLSSSRFPGLSELGVLTASAMALALLSSFTVLPICLNALCPQRER